MADVRERLLESAAALFASKGYAATTVREIVERTGVTKPAMYYYFRSKEGIFLDLMRPPLEGFVGRIESAMNEKGSCRKRLSLLCMYAYDDFVRNLDLARILFSFYYGPPQGAPRIDIDAVHLRFQECVIRVLKDGIRSGEVRRGEPEDMMWIVAGAVNVAMELELVRPSQSIGRRGIERMLDVIFDGIAGNGTREKGKER